MFTTRAAALTHEAFRQRQKGTELKGSKLQAAARCLDRSGPWRIPWPIDGMIALGNPKWRSKTPKEVADFLASDLPDGIYNKDRLTPEFRAGIVRTATKKARFTFPFALDESGGGEILQAGVVAFAIDLGEERANQSGSDGSRLRSFDCTFIPKTS